MFGSRNLDGFDFEQLYHVFTHVNGNEVIFRQSKNYVFFFQKIQKYLLTVVDIYAYCLLPNHFHLLVAYKNKGAALRNLKIKPDEFDDQKTHQVLMKPFGNLLNSCARAYNKMYGRKGALFLDYLKRTGTVDEEYLLNTFRYIHRNPVNHGFVEELADWKYSSYHAYLQPEKFSMIQRTVMLNYFDTTADFINFHQTSVQVNLQ